MQLNDVSLQIADSLFSLLNAVKEICIGRTAFGFFKGHFWPNILCFQHRPNRTEQGSAQSLQSTKKLSMMPISVPTEPVENIRGLK